jgi:hypothetical protein
MPFVSILYTSVALRCRASFRIRVEVIYLARPFILPCSLLIATIITHLLTFARALMACLRHPAHWPYLLSSSDDDGNVSSEVVTRNKEPEGADLNLIRD